MLSLKPHNLIHRSMLLRYLSDCPCFPTALLPSRRVRWEAIDAHSARCHLHDHGLHVSGVFSFNEHGEIVGFSARDTPRLGQQQHGAAAHAATWMRQYGAYQPMRGMMVPTRLESSWKVDGEAPRAYARMELTDIACFDNVEAGSVLASAAHAR